MKNIHLLIFLLPFLLFSCGKKNPPKTKDGKVKIKTTQEWVFNYSDTVPNYNDTIQFKYWKYNEKDELVMFVMNTKQHHDSTEYSYVYDDKGKLIDEIRKSPRIVPYHTKYTYDEKGNKIKVEYIGHADTAYLTYEYRYDEKNNPIVKLSTRSIDSSWFDDRGKETKLKMYSESYVYPGKYELNLEFRYEYDKNGNMIVNDMYNNGYRNSHVILRYDAQNIPTEMLTYHLQNNLKDSLVEHILYQYTYDEHKNPLKIKVFDGKTRKPQKIYLYKYEYY